MVRFFYKSIYKNIVITDENFKVLLNGVSMATASKFLNINKSNLSRTLRGRCIYKKYYLYYDDDLSKIKFYCAKILKEKRVRAVPLLKKLAEENNYL